MPQVFGGFNATRELAYRTAMFALAATEGELGNIGRSAANAWYDVKDALTRFREDGNGNIGRGDFPGHPGPARQTVPKP